MSNEPKRPYFDPNIAQAKRAERAAQLVNEVKRAFGFGTCKVIVVDNQQEKQGLGRAS